MYTQTKRYHNHIREIVSHANKSFCGIAYTITATATNRSESLAITLCELSIKLLY